MSMNRRHVLMFTTPCIEPKHHSPGSYGDISDIYDNEKFSDIKFCFQDENKGATSTQYLHAHKAILSNRSSVFDARFSDRWNGQTEILIDFCSFDAFAAFLFYIYSRRVEASSLSLYQTVELHDLGEQYMEPKVKSRAKRYLSTKLNSVRSFDEILKCYQRASGHQDIQNKLVDRLKNVINLNNCLRIAKFAFENNHDSLLKAAAKFIQDNRKQFANRLNLGEFDADFGQALVTAILDS